MPDNNLEARVQKTVQDGSAIAPLASRDVPYTGASAAYSHFMQDINQARTDLGGDSDAFKAYVANANYGLYQQHSLRDINLMWAQENIGRFANGKDKINLAQVQDALNTDKDPFEREMLRELQDEMLAGRKKKFSKDDAAELLMDWEDNKGYNARNAEKQAKHEQDQRDKAAAQAREAQAQADAITAQHAANNQFMGQMFTTPDGSSTHSLFTLIDDIKTKNGGDGKISYSDLREYQKEYKLNERLGRLDNTFFTPANKAFVDTLVAGWDTDSRVIALRGTYTDSNNRQVPHDLLTLDHLRDAAGASTNAELFRKPSDATQAATVSQNVTETKVMDWAV